MKPISLRLILLFVVLALASILILTIVVSIVYQKEMGFAPWKFVNTSFGFIFEILSLFMAFQLGQVFWEKQKKNEKRLENMHSVSSYIRKLIEIITILENSLSSLEKTGRNDQLEKDIVTGISKIKLWGDTFFMFFKDIELSDQSFINEFIDGIYPAILNLSSITVIWGNQKELKEVLALLKQETNALINKSYHQ